MVIEVNKINWGKSITVGITAGLVAGLVKLGWENILPPQTPERDQTNPPQKCLNNLAFRHRSHTLLIPIPANSYHG